MYNADETLPHPASLPLQTKDLKTFQASQKAEEKQVSRDVKEEVERSLPKVEQKQVLRRRLSDIQGLHAERVSSLLVRVCVRAYACV